MNDTLHKTFQDLVSLKITPDSTDILKDYLEIASRIEIDDYLQYCNNHKKYMEDKHPRDKHDFFHIILSVKVSNESSRLIPFFSIYSKNINTTEMRQEMFLLGQKDIQYDFSSFLSTYIRDELNKKNEVPCCLFKVDYFSDEDINISELAYLSKINQSRWIDVLFDKTISNKEDNVITLEKLLRQGSGKNTIDKLKDNLLNVNRPSFVRVFSKYYHEKHQVNSLWYTFYNMDSAFDSPTCLTRLMIISTHPDEVPEFMYKQLHKIGEIVSLIRSRYVYDLLQKNQHEAIRSAKAAIMSRNMSHNLGSHVMFYIKQRLESVEKILSTGALKNLVTSSSLDEIREKVKGDVSLGKEMPFLVGLGRFLNYLQERQDYIATVATSYIPYNTCINFKEAIYDELKPEKHSQRHKGDATGRQAANLLLDYIAKSEGFDKSEKIELWFGDNFNGGDEENTKVPDDLRTFNVSLPGGNLGRQAIFSIMENIIRNTAKHDGSKSKNKLVFQFDILSPDNITDLEGYSKRKYETYDLATCYSNYQNDFVYLGITVKLSDENGNIINNVNGLDETIKQIKFGLERPYINEDNGEMDEECKGLKEIRLSAAWIRGKGLDTDIPNGEPPAVSIRKNNNHLQYIICLPKPQKVAIVSSSYVDMDIYHTQNCRVFKPNDILELSKFELIVYHGEEDDFYNKKIRPFVGARLFADKLLTVKNDEKLFQDISLFYNKWIEYAFYNEKADNKNVKISIIDHKAPAEISTEDTIKDMVLATLSTSETRNDYYKNNILFNTHYKGQSLEDNGGLFAQARFVEAISGGDSTDRLIRRDIRNFEWFCKHLSAGLTQVAIFDERLYSMIMPLSGTDRDVIEKVVKSFVTEHTIGASLEEFWNYPEFAVLNLTKNDLYRVFIESKNSDKVLDPNQIVAGFIKKKVKDYSKTWKYREMGVWAFNILVDNHEILIKGYNAIPTRAEIGLYNPYYKECIIGRINKGTFKIEWEPNCKGFENNFDFITIHQGLLDKIYGELGIKKDNEKKELVTKAIFDAFSAKFESAVEIETGKRYYLPQFIIHSGRSKPNKEDMPQRQPFLQFSAIDHALRDCKYTLTELLYSAHYE